MLVELVGYRRHLLTMLPALLRICAEKAAVF